MEKTECGVRGLSKKVAVDLTVIFKQTLSFPLYGGGGRGGEGCSKFGLGLFFTYVC